MFLSYQGEKLQNSRYKNVFVGEQVQRPDNDLESRNHLVYLEPDSRAKNQSSLNLKKVEQASDKRNKGIHKF